MAGHQFGFSYNDDNNISVLKDTIKGRVYEYLQEYGIEDNDVVHISIGFTRLDKNLISEFILDDKVKHNLGKISKPITGIPLSIESKSFGVPLSVNVTDGLITRINLKNLRNFLELIEDKSELLPLNHKDKIGKFPDSWQFYETIINKIPCIVGINIISPTEIDKIRFTVEGAVYSRVIDSIEGNITTRKYNNKIVNFTNDGEFLSIFREVMLNYVPTPKYDGERYLPNVNIGVIDTETYKVGDDTAKVYAAGFRSVLDSEPQTFYIDKESLDSTKLICDMLDNMLRPKYSDITWYCHNLSGFDAIFIINALLRHNEINADNKYTIDTIFRKN